MRALKSSQNDRNDSVIYLKENSVLISHFKTPLFLRHHADSQRQSVNEENCISHPFGRMRVTIV